MLKTTVSSQVLAANEVLVANEVYGVEGSGKSIGKCGKSLKTGKSFKSGKSKGKKSAKSKNPSKSGNSPNFDATKVGPSLLTPEARAAFNRLQLAFTEAPILQYFDPECHIRIKTDASGYAIGGVLSQLASGSSPDGVVTKADLGQLHPVAFFSRKMISAETCYETHNGELLAIVKASRPGETTWKAVSLRFSFLRTTITSVVSWIQRA